MLDRFTGVAAYIKNPLSADIATESQDIDQSFQDRCKRLVAVGAPGLAMNHYDVAVWKKRESEGENMFGNIDYRRIE